MQRTTDWNNERFHLFCAPRSTKFTHTQETQLQHSHRLTSCNKKCFQCQTQPGIRALTCEESKACLRSNEIWEVKKHSSREPGKVTKRKNVNSFFPSPSFSLSLSLSLTHTHTHTQHSLMVRGMTSSSDSSPAGAGRVQEAWAEEGGQSPPSSPAPPCSRCFPAGGRRHFLPFCQPSRAPMDSVLPEGLCSLTTF